MFYEDASTISYSSPSSNGNIFRVTGPLWEESNDDFPSQRPVTRSFDVLFDIHIYIWYMNKRLNIQLRHRWFETPPRSLWLRCNVTLVLWFATSRYDVMSTKRIISLIPQCTCSLSHDTPFKTEMCIFLFWMVYCGIFVYCRYCHNDNHKW